MPPPTASKRITSAPSWASVMPPRGAATNAEPSTTRRPSSGVGSSNAAALVMACPPSSGASAYFLHGGGRAGGRRLGAAQLDLADVAHGAAVGAGGQRGVGLQGQRDLTFAVVGGPRRVAASLLVDPALGEHLVGDVERDAAGGDVDGDRVTVADEADEPALGRLGGDVADRQARRTAGEAAVGEQGAGLPQAAALDVRGRVQHLLHARPALGAL